VLSALESSRTAALSIQAVSLSLTHSHTHTHAHTHVRVHTHIHYRSERDLLTLVYKPINMFRQLPLHTHL